LNYGIKNAIGAQLLQLVPRLKITNIAEIKDKLFIVKANRELIKYTWAVVIF